VAKIKQSRKSLGGRLKATELPLHGSRKNAGNASLVSSLFGSQPRRESTLEVSAKELSVVGKVTSPDGDSGLGKLSGPEYLSVKIHNQRKAGNSSQGQDSWVSLPG
jgi:hypothetical protein